MTTEPSASDDTRNVIDRYKGWPMDAIIADLDARRHPFHIAIENWQHDFNIGSVVRTANAFLAKEVHIIGRRRWNRRGAMVTDRYQHVQHHPTVEEFVAWARAEQLPVLGIDNLPGSVPLETYDLPKACVLVFGQESVGLSDEVREAADAVLALARAKAEEVARSHETDAIVLGCDSMLEFGGHVVGKPGDASTAIERWRRMRGNTGVLHTGHWLVDDRDQGTGGTLGATSSTTVHFADLSDEEIEAYVATGEPLNVAGAFTVDGLGGPYVESIEGDYHGVVGVSLPLLRHLLTELGVAFHELRN